MHSVSISSILLWQLLPKGKLLKWLCGISLLERLIASVQKMVTLCQLLTDTVGVSYDLLSPVIRNGEQALERLIADWN